MVKFSLVIPLTFAAVVLFAFVVDGANEREIQGRFISAEQLLPGGNSRGGSSTSGSQSKSESVSESESDSDSESQSEETAEVSDSEEKESSSESKKGGELGSVKKADSFIQGLVKELVQEIRNRACALVKCRSKSRDKGVTALSYRIQNVAGTLFFVAVRVERRIFHVKIFQQTWTHTLEVENLEGPKKKKDPIEYF